MIPRILLALAFWLGCLSLSVAGNAIDASTSAFLRSLYRESGGFAVSPDTEEPSLAATNMVLRTYRYLGVPTGKRLAQRKFLLGRFDASIPAFVEAGENGASVMGNAMALMLMAELGMPDDVHAVSAQRYLLDHAETDDEIYMAMAGLAVMGLSQEVPGTWVRRMIELCKSEDPAMTEYAKARALITLGRLGLQLPDYSEYQQGLEDRLEALNEQGLLKSPETLQAAYTIGRALVMMDGRALIKLPRPRDLLAEDGCDISRIYRVAVLNAWRPALGGELRVAICTGFAPVGYRDESGMLAGLDVDLIRSFCEDHDYRLTFHPIDKFDGIWELPGRGVVDLAMSGLSKRRDRLTPGIRWSYPYFNVDRSLTILKKNRDRFRDIADFDGAKIAVTAGTTGEEDVRKRNPNAIRVPYDNEAAAIADLLAGKVHALARGDVSNRWDARQHPELVVIDTHPMDPVEEFVISVSGERVAMGQKLDRWLIEARRSGKLDDVFAAYLESSAGKREGGGE